MAAGGVSLEIDTLNSDCGISLTVSADRIVSSKASAFATGEDNELSGAGSVSRSLKQHFSYDYNLAKKKLSNDGGRKFEISGVYPCQFTWKGTHSVTIYHSVVPTMGMRGFNMDAWKKSMKKLYLQLFAKASLDVKELAVPVLGSGGAGAPFTEAAKTLLETFLSFKPESKHFKLKMITVYVYPETNLQPMKKLMKEAQEKFSIKTPKSVQEMELAKHRTVSDASNNTLAEKNRTHSKTRSSDVSLNFNSSPHSKTNRNFVDTKKPNSKAIYHQDSNLPTILGNLSLTEDASDASKLKKPHIKRDCTKADSKSEDDCNAKEVSDLDGRDTHAGEDKENVEVDTKAGNDVEENMDIESDSNEEQSPHEKEEEDKCAICLDQINNPKKLDKCGHKYCSECIEYYFQHHKPACPTCNTMYGIITGNQPKNGKMDTTLIPSIHLPGYENCGAIVIDYTFPSGIQDKDHPNPNEAYSGTHRRAYLPDCAEGRKVCDLLRVAFDKHLIFTVGSSRTTGADNVVTWNDIHHKTRIDGGPTRFGYPDPTYLSRVQEELAAKGVTEASLKSNYNHNKIVHKN